MYSRITRKIALAQYRLRARFYDVELAACNPVRVKAIEGLKLQRGDTVPDVGCGTGLSFEYLQRKRQRISTCTQVL